MKYRTEAEKVIRASTLTGVKALREIDREMAHRYGEAVCDHFEEDERSAREIDRNYGRHPDDK